MVVPMEFRVSILNPLIFFPKNATVCELLLIELTIIKVLLIIKTPDSLTEYNPVPSYFSFLRL
jgi:hypothetical protein